MSSGWRVVATDFSEGMVREARAAILSSAYDLHPERFVRNHPEPPRLPVTSWINKPTDPKENSTQ